jgi:hypothetical protein
VFCPLPSTISPEQFPAFLFLKPSVHAGGGFNITDSKVENIVDGHTCSSFGCYFIQRWAKML